MHYTIIILWLSLNRTEDDAASKHENEDEADEETGTPNPAKETPAEVKTPAEEKTPDEEKLPDEEKVSNDEKAPAEEKAAGDENTPTEMKPPEDAAKEGIEIIDDDAESVAGATTGSVTGSITGAPTDELIWPSMQDLNTRLRRVITSYQRNYKKEELKQQQKAKVSPFFNGFYLLLFRKLFSFSLKWVRVA